MESTKPGESPLPKRRRKWRRWVLLALLLGGLWWLNGPGLRWMAPKIAAHFMEKAGIRGGFSLDGTLAGGITVRDLHLATDGPLAALSVDRVSPVYRLKEVIHGRVDGIVVKGVHADLDLDRKSAKTKPEDGGESPLDLAELSDTIRVVRERVLPVAVTLEDVSLNIVKDRKPFFTLAPSALHHDAGKPGIALDLGAITDATGREWPAASTNIVWNKDELLVDHLAPLPGVSIDALSLKMPAGAEPSAETELRVDDAVLLVGASPGFKSVRVDLSEGRLGSEKLGERFALDLPVKAELTSLSVNVDGVLPDPKAATGELRLLLENIEASGWQASEISLDARLDDRQATLNTSCKALGTEFDLGADLPVSRSGEKWRLGDLTGHLNIPDVPSLVTALSERFKAIDPDAKTPPSSVDADFHVFFEELRPTAADLELALKPSDPKIVTPVGIKGKWEDGKPVAAAVELDGLKVSGEYDLKQSIYQADATLEGFRSARIERWLAVAGVKVGGKLALDCAWTGGGNVIDKSHHGSLKLASAEFTRGKSPVISADGGITYDWPKGVNATELRVKSNDQIVALDAKLGEGWLELTKLDWTDHERRMATGSAKLPVPDDYSKWREMLANDARPIDVSIQSEVLPLAALKDWAPQASNLDSRSTGQLDLRVAGTYAEPAIDARLEARDLRSPQQPKLPPADLKITLTGKGGRLSLEGSAIAPDFPPAVMTASMPFCPAVWAEDGGRILKENLTARVDLPRLDLSRFTTLVPMARKLGGVLTGNIEVAGQVGSPVIKGRLDLSNAGFEAKDPSVPPVTGAGFTANLTMERISLENLRASVAGGTVQGGGSLAIVNRKPGALEFRVKADHLPLARNDSLIARANADLRLAGTLEKSDLTGTVGVVDSLFYRDIELLPIGSPFTAPSAASLPKIDAPSGPPVKLPEPFDQWGLNVDVRTEDPFLIRGNIATGRVDVKLKVGGTLGNPAPAGEVKISDFRASLPFSTLEIRNGVVRFDPSTGLDPVLEIRGTSEPRPYRVNVYVYGRASNPQLTLTSNPPLPENEIMTLLATGTTTSGLENPQTASARAMQLLAEELRRGRFAVGKQLRPLLGLLDRVDFSLAEEDPYSSESYSTATLELTDRWFLSAGMGDDGDSRVLGIWRLTFR